MFETTISTHFLCARRWSSTSPVLGLSYFPNVEMATSGNSSRFAAYGKASRTLLCLLNVDPAQWSIHLSMAASLATSQGSATHPVWNNTMWDQGLQYAAISETCRWAQWLFQDFDKPSSSLFVTEPSQPQMSKCSSIVPTIEAHRAWVPCRGHVVSV